MVLVRRDPVLVIVSVDQHFREAGPVPRLLPVAVMLEDMPADSKGRRQGGHRQQEKRCGERGAEGHAPDSGAKVPPGQRRGGRECAREPPPVLE